MTSGFFSTFCKKMEDSADLQDLNSTIMGLCPHVHENKV